MGIYLFGQLEFVLTDDFHVVCDLRLEYFDGGQFSLCQFIRFLQQRSPY